jgi:hypothetical protein
MATPFWDLGPGEKVGDKDGRVYVEFNPQLLTPWERVKIAGFDLPGRSTVISPGRVRKVQRNGGPGDEAEEIIDVGALAADVQIIVQVWTPEHLEQWDAFSDRMRDLFAEARDDTGKKSAPALDVDHPGLNLAGAPAVVDPWRDGVDDPRDGVPVAEEGENAVGRAVEGVAVEPETRARDQGGSLAAHAGGHGA